MQQCTKTQRFLKIKNLNRTIKMANKNIWFIITIILIGVLVLGAVGIISFNIFKPSKCIPEHGAIGFGVGMKPTGECCDGLVIKSPSVATGFTGGGFCMKPQCDIECMFIGSKSEGFYDTCSFIDTALNEDDSLSGLIKWTDCSPNVGTVTFYVIRNNVCIEVPNPNAEEKRFGSLSDCNENLGIINPDKQFLCTEFWGNHPELNKEELICYFLYDPVCGDDGRTYSNDCIACRSNLKTYTKGEC